VKVQKTETKEDPAVTAARDREQARADASFITNTQGLLDDETRRRARRFGQRIALTGANPAGGGMTGGQAPTATGAPAGFTPLASVNGSGVSIV